MKKPSEGNKFLINISSYKVSVCVITYNHELYIAQCLQSIIDQCCSFNFELIVRDDCSQDGTLEVIRSFQARYPLIIKLLDAEKNIGANKNILAVFAAAKGEYLALCEGDDYWIDTGKLEKQVIAMDSQSELTFTAHPCWIHDKEGLTIPAYVKSLHYVNATCQHVLDVPGQFAPTASYMFRRKLIDILPSWFAEAPVGDFFIEMYAIGMGSGLYMSEPMSVYRTFSVGSWSASNSEKQTDKLIEFSEAMISCIVAMQKESIFNGLNFSKKLSACYFNIAIGALLKNEFNYFKSMIIKSRNNFPNLSLTQSIFYFFKEAPTLILIMYKVKRALLNNMLNIKRYILGAKFNLKLF